MSYHRCRLLVFPPLLFSAVAFYCFTKCHGHRAGPSARVLLAAQGAAMSLGQPRRTPPALSSAAARGEQQQQLQKQWQDLVPLAAAAASTAVPGCVPARCLPQLGKLA